MSEHRHEAAKLENADSSVRTTLAKSQAQMTLRKKIRHMEASRLNRDTTLSSGSYVSMVNSKIAPLSNKVKKERHYRVKIHGHVIEESEVFVGWFLVYFYETKKYFYVLDNNRIVTNLFSPFPHCLVDSNDNFPAFINNNTCSSEDEKIILSHILNSKVHKTNGHNRISMRELLCIFKPKFPWLNLTKMYKYLKEETGAHNNSIFSSEATIAKEEGESQLWFTHDLLMSNGEYLHLYSCIFMQ